MRKLAKNEFEKTFFKLANNSVYGRTMMNVRNHRDVRFVKTEEQLKKLVNKPNFSGARKFQENLIGVEMKKKCVMLNQPIYVGFSILEISKTLMYDFHYGYIIPKYEKRAKLLFTDTDSLCYEIKTEDIYADMKSDIHLFDTSEYPKNHILYSEENKKVLGKMKDESFGRPIAEFVGLRSKMYSLLGMKKTAKGVSRYVVEKSLNHAQYKDCLFKSQFNLVQMNQILSNKHVVNSVTRTKIGLSPFDDKRYVLKDGMNTLAYGHYRIKELEEEI